MKQRDPKRIVREHESWRARCINLIPSENVMSKSARSLLASDMGHRYTLPRIREMDGRIVENAYRGTRYLDQVEGLAEDVARRIFRCGYACVRPISGHISALIALTSLLKRGDTIMSVSFSDGGYPGYDEQEMAGMLGLRTAYLPFDEEECDIDYSAAAEAIEEVQPQAVILGASKMMFPPDVSRIRGSCDEVGAKLLYDGSHVLGLIAGGEFGEPLKEGADILFGSTHKTLFGPQGGVVLADSKQIAGAVETHLHWKTLDNAHWNRIASLAQTLLEMESFGEEYAKQVVANARRLARSLDGKGIPVQAREKGYTRSHQVGLRGAEVAKAVGASSFEEVAKRLEQADIIIDCVGRLGTAESTRLGMRESEMDVVADLISRILIEDEEPASVREDVHALKSRFREPVFCFDRHETP